MKDLSAQIVDWAESDSPFAIATVVATWGSSPRPVGSTMLIDVSGRMAGSVSGGCVEGAVIKAASNLLESGGGKKLAYGVTDDDAWAVGLSCGGKIQVYIERFLKYDGSTPSRQCWDAMRANFQTEGSFVLITEMVDGTPSRCLINADGTRHGDSVSDELADMAMTNLYQRKSGLTEHDDKQYFIQVFPRKSQMLIIGAAHVTTHLVELAHLFEFESIVIDPRDAFAANTQFLRQPDAIHAKYPAEVLGDYSLDAFTYAVILSHDPKIDDNALEILLRSDVAYIGALGSKRTHAKRIARLEEKGFIESELAKIHAPIGENINAIKPREIALSIMAQIIRIKNQFYRK